MVVVTAGIGAGHDGAAREWASRLEQQGFHTHVVDLLDVLPDWASTLLRDGYEAALHRVAWTWSLVFHLSRLRPVISLVDAVLYRYRHRLLSALPASTVACVSTYPLAGRMLGQLRARGEFAGPVHVFVTDFSVHPLWIAPGADALCVVHARAAAAAERLGASRVEVTGPLVPEHFHRARMVDEESARAARLHARRAFSLPEVGRLALVVAGSWGVGEVERSSGELATGLVALPVVVCGRNEALRSRLTARGVLALGWVDDMARLLEAVDVMIENAGGLSSLEAMAAGVPIITYRPLPGHGRANATALREAGVTTWVRDRAALSPALRATFDGDAGERSVSTALTLFVPDPVKTVVGSLSNA